jgi:tetratricopeptide (TPR) repeat protein
MDNIPLSKKPVSLFFLALMLYAIPLPAQVDSLSNILELTQNNEIKADLLNELADYYMYRNLDSALFFAQEAITTSRNGGYQKGEILALINKSEIYRELGNYEMAQNYTDRVKIFAEKLTDKELLAKYYLLAGYNYMCQHIYNQALEQYEKSFALFRECGDLVGMGDVQRKIGHSFASRNEYGIMYEYFLGALDCYQKANNQRGIAASMNNIGQYYFLNKDYQNAEMYFRKAINLNSKEGNLYWLSKNYINLSDIKEKSGQPDSVIYFSQMALCLAREVGNPYWEGITLIQMGILYLKNGSHDTALNFLYDGLKLSKQINSFENLTDISDLINQAYYEKGQIDSAYRYQQLRYKYADSLNQNNSNLEFTELKYQMEIERNQQKVALRDQKRFFIHLLIFSCLVLIIIILILLYTRQKIRTRNTNLEKENLTNKIELKNKEAASNLLIAQKKNEIIGNVIKNIEDNRMQLPENSRAILDKITYNLGSMTEKKGWDSFELSFSQVHETFFTKLDKQFPSLTTNKDVCVPFYS